MKVLLLGATGDMGQRAAQHLVQSNAISRLTVAGRRLEGAGALAHRLGPSAEPLAIDVDNRADLLAAMQNHDVVAGAVGPYYVHEKKMAEVAIEAGTDYISLCDDHDAMMDVLQLNDAAKAKGVTVLSGIGWTPGITSFMAKKGVATLDEAHTVDVAWVGAASTARGRAVILHTLHILTGRVPTFASGEPQTVAAGTGKQRLRFPDPIGTVTVSHVGHPEPVTLPMFIPGLRQVTCKGGLTEPFLNGLSGFIARTGLTRSYRARTVLARMMMPLLPLLAKIGAPPSDLSAVRVDVHGTRAGRAVMVTMGAVGTMADLTAIPLAIGAVMIGQGQWRHPGVIAPEALSNPDIDVFFAELEQHGITFTEAITEGASHAGDLPHD